MKHAIEPEERKRESNWHHIRDEEVARLLDVDPLKGLAEAEAARRLHSFGPNRITPLRGVPSWVKLLRQFHAPLVYILLAAAGVTAFLGEWVDSSVIFGVVLVNAVVGFLQEAKAEKSIESLSNLLTTESEVRRGGNRMRVASEALVQGDVVLLRSGDRVPADLRLFEAKGLQVDESALTGESVPVYKHCGPLALDTVLADRKNLAYAGTLVTAGRGEGLVWATGDRSETGHIARLMSETVDLSTPLTKKIAEFSALLVRVILLLAAATFAIGVARGEKASEMFMAAVALAVGAVPEGLPAAVTIVLAIGVSRMARRRAIIRRLPAVETLGSTTVICSDKTGTLTENQMTVQRIYAGGLHYRVSGTGYETRGSIEPAAAPTEATAPESNLALMECLRAGLLCNDSGLVRDANGRLTAQGDPTEAALIVAAEKAGLAHREAHRDAPLVDTIPFESEHMFRATLHGGPDGRVVYKVGAVERMLPRCSDGLDATGKRVPLDKDAVQDAVEAMASGGLRVLAFARRHMDAGATRLEHGHLADGLTFLGLQGMIDPPRPEAIESVRRCQEAGILVKMITGDHLATARAIAGQIGLKGGGEDGALAAVSGRELEAVSDADLPALADRAAVFARVAPEQKLRLVCALQSRGHVVAMTGDGVNDAPALRQADIGVAMGVGGTEVAKSAASMVLTDDNFASIGAAVEEGRGVFDNLTKFIVWTLPMNAGAALILLAAIALGATLPALPVQLLWVNMMTAILLGLMLAFEPKEKGLMQRPPRDPKRPLLTFALLMGTGLVSAVMLAGAFWLFAWESKVEGGSIAGARTAVVNVIVAVEIAYLFNCRSLTRPTFAIGTFSNPWVLFGSAAMVAAQLLFTYAPPMNRLFHSAPMDAGAWLRIAAVAAASFLVVETEKWLRFGRGRGDHVVPE